MHRHTEQKRAYDSYKRIQTDETNIHMTEHNWQHRHTVSESADKIVLKTKIKRGEATRDEDRIEVKVKGDDPEQVGQKLQETVKAVQENGTVDELRQTQAGESE